MSESTQQSPAIQLQLESEKPSIHYNESSITTLNSEIQFAQNSTFFESMKKRMKKKGDHRPRNSAQYERVVELLIMHKAKWTPRQISLLPSVSRPRSERFLKLSDDRPWS